MVRVVLAAAVLAGVLAMGSGATASADEPIPTRIDVNRGYLLSTPRPGDSLLGIPLPVSVALGFEVDLRTLTGDPVAGTVEFVSNGQPICTARQGLFSPPGRWQCLLLGDGAGPGLVYGVLGFPMEARFAGGTIGGKTYLPSSVRLPLIGAGLP